MRKLFLLFILISFTRFIFAQTATAPSTGDGSESTPYQIATLENLYWIAASDDEVSSPNQATRWSSCYIQVNDIDASSTSTWNPDGSGGYEGWDPIGYYDYVGDELYPFTGIYDGGNYNITGLFINRPNTNDMALFGVIAEAQIKNLGLTNIDITGYDDVAGLIGLSFNSTVTNCFTTGEVAGNNYSSAGLIGYNGDGSITNCYSSVNVTGTWEVGGLIGTYYVFSEGEIHNCYSSGNIVGTENHIGGLVGFSRA